MSIYPRAPKLKRSRLPDRPVSGFKLSVVIPLYNEAESLVSLHAEICAACDGNRIPFEAVYVDDGSTDGSFQVLEKLHRMDPRAKAIQLRKNCGKSEALAAGFRAATGDVVVTMDADLQDDPAEIPNLLAKLDEGFDLVSGWKKTRRDPLSKRLPSKFFNRTTAILTGLRLHDFNCGLKAYRREVAKTVQVYGEAPPSASSVAAYAVPSVPWGRLSVSRFSGGAGCSSITPNTLKWLVSPTTHPVRRLMVEAAIAEKAADGVGR